MEEKKHNSIMWTGKNFDSCMKFIGNNGGNKIAYEDLEEKCNREGKFYFKDNILEIGDTIINYYGDLVVSKTGWMNTKLINKPLQTNGSSFIPSDKIFINGRYDIVENSSIDRDKYEKELDEKQKRHLSVAKSIARNSTYGNWKPCMHDQCTLCFGTGRKADNSFCIHYIACSCPKCSPYC